MDPQPKGPVEYPLDTGVTPEQFEILTYLLARDEFSEAVPVRQNDFGLDARLPDSRLKTLRGWQAKHYPNDVDWRHCRNSVARAVAFWRPHHITFTFPKILSADEQEKFRTKLVEEFPLLRLDWWDAIELQRRLRDTEGGKRAAVWLFSDPAAQEEALQRALTMSGDLRDARHAAERLAEIQGFIGQDPHLFISAASSQAGAPQTTPAEETMLSVETEIDDERIRFDAAERYPGAASDAGLAGRLVFSDDKAGRDAKDAVERVMREGGSAQISEGVSALLDKVPVGLRGLVPETALPGTIEITAVDPKPVPMPGLPVLVQAGSAELGLVLGGVEPRPEWDMTAAGSAGGLEVFMSYRGDEDAREANMSWRWQLGEGSAMEQLLAAHIMLAAHRGDEIVLINPLDGDVLVRALMDKPAEPEKRIKGLEAVCEFLGLVSEVEAWIEAPLDPPAEPTGDDASVLRELLPRIRKPEEQGGLKSIDLVLSRPTSELDGVFQLSICSAFRATLFGTERYFGMDWIHVPRACVRELSGEEQPGDKATVVPEGDPKATKRRFYRPSEVDESAAKSPGPPLPEAS